MWEKINRSGFRCGSNKNLAQTEHLDQTVPVPKKQNTRTSHRRAFKRATMMTPTQKSDTYGNFFCNNKGDRLNNVMWDLVYSKTKDPLYVQVYNSQKNTVESLSLTLILQDLMFNYLYPFPDKTVNPCNQINLYGFYFVSAPIYYLIQQCWNEISTNGFSVNTNPEESDKCYGACSNDNNFLEKGFYVGEWNMEGAYMKPVC